MKGFNIDKDGNALSVAVDWEPSYIDEDGKEVKVEQPEGTVYPENFDEIFVAMTAPVAERKKPKFKDGKSTLAVDDSEEVLIEIEAAKERKEKRKELLTKAKA